jgi:hypothetical protein
MSSAEIILGSLVGEKIQGIQGKLEYYDLPMEIKAPNGKSWTNDSSITLEGFLQQHPIPKNPDQNILYGIAWEFVWGCPKPQKIIDMKEDLFIRARYGFPITDMEKLWINIAAVDTDDF